MGVRRKAQAGGILRTCADSTWQTPESILGSVRMFFAGPIPFDPASAPDNPTRALRFCCGAPGTMFERLTMSRGLPMEVPTPQEAMVNGLEVPWEHDTFVNPPYGRELNAWLDKIAKEARRGVLILALLPVNRTEQKHMQGALALSSAECLVYRRVKFVSSIDGREVGGNPYASWIQGYNVEWRKFWAVFSELGTCRKLQP